MAHKLIVVSMNDSHSDIGLMLDGNFIMTVDCQCGDDLSVLESTAENIAETLGVPVNNMAIDKPGDDWDWDLVKEIISSPSPDK